MGFCGLEENHKYLLMKVLLQVLICMNHESFYHE